MGKKEFKLGVIIPLGMLLILLLFYILANNQIKYTEKSTSMIDGGEILAELNNITEIEQTFNANMDFIDKISLKITTLGRSNEGIVTVQLIDRQTNRIMDEIEIETSLLQDGTYYEWKLNNEVENAKGKEFCLRFVSKCEPGMAPGIYYSNDFNSTGSLVYNNKVVEGSICFAYAGKSSNYLGTYYWKIVFVIEFLIVFWLLFERYRYNLNKKTFIFHFYDLWNKYKFLIQQLVSRDFKTKYKRSVLGYLWSFLNPLLTMIVQYIVFSTVFRSDIKNFPVYLLSGIVLFNFFTDSVGQGLSAIVGNTALITKVYVPKYIYPITKVLSSSINLIISMIPLLIMMIFTGTKITKAILLMPFVVLCLLVFCTGLSLLLSAAMVFFRDTQYLWGIVSLAWMYATPLFYPESIIPSAYRFIHKLNPMYYIIKFARCILIDGVSPEISLYIWCILCSCISLIIGLIVFKKTQDKFVLYL